jgi:hypothetical protein
MSMEAEDIIGICYQAMNGEDMGDSKDLACAVVICKVHKSVRLLELLVFPSYKHPINPIINPNPMSSH